MNNDRLHEKNAGRKKSKNMMMDAETNYLQREKRVYIHRYKISRLERLVCICLLFIAFALELLTDGGLSIAFKIEPNKSMLLDSRTRFTDYHNFNLS